LISLAHVPTLMELEVIHSGVACRPRDASWPIQLLTRAGFLPLWLLVFDFTLALLAKRPYFFVMKLLIFVFWFNYLKVLAGVLRIEHPREFDYVLCGAERYAVPDARFVTTVQYVLVMLFGFWQDVVLRNGVLSRWNIFVVHVVALAYIGSTLASRYFSWWLLAVNLVITGFITLATIVLYLYAVHCYRTDDDSWWLKSLFGKLALLTNIGGSVFAVETTRDERYNAGFPLPSHTKKRRKRRKNSTPINTI